MQVRFLTNWKESVSPLDIRDPNSQFQGVRSGLLKKNNGEAREPNRRIQNTSRVGITLLVDATGRHDIRRLPSGQCPQTQGRETTGRLGDPSRPKADSYAGSDRETAARAACCSYAYAGRPSPTPVSKTTRYACKADETEAPRVAAGKHDNAGVLRLVSNVL
jgi:hypothetical protein